MQPAIKTLTEKKLVGKKMQMSFTNNQTKQLWQSFMPQRKEIIHTIGHELYSLEVYNPLFFKNFNPNAEFDKWAAVEVADFTHVPEGMETITVPTGLYAVFLHKGPVSDGAKTYLEIFENWLPNADFVLDDRPHFAVMGEKYKHDDPDSEEEIWIPVVPK